MNVLSGSLPIIANKMALDQYASDNLAGTVMVPLYETIVDIQNQVAAASYAVSHPIFTVPPTVSSVLWQIAGVTVRFGTQSTSGTLQVEVAPTNTAIGSGTNQLTGTISLATAGHVNINQNGTVISSPTQFGPGSSVNLIFGGTVTGLLNAVVAIDLQRVG